MLRPRWLTSLCLFLAVAMSGLAHASIPTRFEVTLAPSEKMEGVLRGRLLVIITKDGSREPRLQITRNGPAIIGMEIESIGAGQTVVIDNTAIASPPLDRMPAGDYWVQAVFVRYEETKRADGHTIWVPRAERRPFAQLTGNHYSAPVLVRLDATQRQAIRLVMDRKVEALPPAADTQWVKHFRIKSALLSKFWGRPMYLGASVLVPRGWAESSKSRYPIIYQMSPGQDASRPYFFSSDPIIGNRSFGPEVNVQSGYDFYKSWVSDGFPKVLVASIIQPTPYFLEGYATDSANNGPVGRAIVEELMPAIEKQFRAIAKPYSRIVQGLSTGGWEALSLQVKYPDVFGGVWTYNPDPIDFRRFVVGDIYRDENAFEVPYNDWTWAERPFQRTIEGQTVQTMRELSLREAAMGSRGRSGGQLDAWNAAYGPVGQDGYPVELWDKKTGVINPEAAKYMRENGYDLTHYIGQNWEKLGPKLEGKIHLISADMDEYHLNLSIYKFIDMVREKGGANYPIRIVYGHRKGHDWHHVNFAEMIEEVADHVMARTPEGESRDWGAH